MPSSSSKECRDCGQDKALEDFPPQAHRLDGRGPYCRPCMNVRHRVYRDAKRVAPRIRVTNAEPPSARTRKWCPRCAQEKSVEDFGANRSTADGRTAYCRPCHNETGRVNRIERNGSTRDYHLRRRYGLTSADVDALVVQQDGLCAICARRAPEHVDHDHVSGAVRGVLCSGCNQGLGNFRDDTDALRRAIDYLETPTWQRTLACTAASRLTSLRLAAPPSRTSSA